MKREEQVKALESHEGKDWDLIVIGGGATGLGIALDSATRGYKTLLLEKNDFASGTSSRSTKLVHGGVRYLARGDVFLVVEALKERGLILRNAPHLTANQEFVIPLYTWFDLLLYTVGLKVYDILSGNLSLGKSEYISREETIKRLPNIKDQGLKGGVVYHDGQFDDSRLALAVASAAASSGATLINYFNVDGLIKSDGRLAGVTATDRISGIKYEIHSGAVVNATGVFADQILQMDDPPASHIIRPSQGIHLVADMSFLKGNSAIMIPKTDDGRVLFAIPWYGKVVIGTTDTPLDKIEEEPLALEIEKEFILNTASKYFVSAPGKNDVLSVFAGLRPLAADPSNPESTKEISRRHKIIASESGLFSVTGGKWTTYRLMAEETIDKIIDKGMLPERRCRTKHLSLLPGGVNLKGDRLEIYGSGMTEIDRMFKSDDGNGTPVSESLPYTFGEIRWICRNEMPVMVEDILARRTRALFLDARASLLAAPVVAKIMAEELRHDAGWAEEQVEKYSILVKKYIF